MNNEVETVSIVMPCRNEGKYIARCLNSVVNSDYPKEQLEVLVVDGRSTDKSREIISDYMNKYSFVKLLDNPRKIQTFATNAGLKKATGNVIIRMDAHVQYPRNYISKSVYWLKKSGVDCVGGICRTKPGDHSLMAQAIALSLSNPFGVGNSYFRIGSVEPKYVDTVPFGCYKKEVFKRVGLFNPDLDRTDDVEFNLRLKRKGGKILLTPEIESDYYARSNLKDLFKQNYWNGFWIIYSLRFVDLPFSSRHLVPFIFVSSLLVSIFMSAFFKPFIHLFTLIGSVYLITNMLFSFNIVLKKGIKYFPFLIVSFLTLHFSYGLGSIWGGLKLIGSKTLDKANQLIFILRKSGEKT